MNLKFQYVLCILGTMAFFYMPYGPIVEVLLWVAVIVILCSYPLRALYRKWTHQRSLRFAFFGLILVHIVVLLGMVMFAPMGGQFKRVDTSHWNGMTLENILQDMAAQTSFFYSQLGRGLSSEETKQALTETVQWPENQLAVGECAYLLTQRTPYWIQCSATAVLCF